jgi:hypothetical protein
VARVPDTPPDPMSPSALPMREAVEATARALAECRTLLDAFVTLRDLGHPERFADRLIFLVRHAFGAVVYGLRGIEFSKQFLSGPRGKEQTHTFALQPGYDEARLLAQRWLQANRQDLVDGVVDWCNEAIVTRAHLEDGKPLAALNVIEHIDCW